MKTSTLLKQTISPLVLVLALAVSAHAQNVPVANEPPALAAPDEQADLVPEPPNDEAAAAAASNPAPDVNVPESSASAAPDQFAQPPADDIAPPTIEAEVPAPTKVVRQKPHVKTAKEQLAFDKKLLKDTKAKIAKTLQAERQGDKDMKKAKAAIKTAEANLAAAKKKKAKIEASLRTLEKTRIALEKTVKKTTVAVAKDTQRAAANRVPASVR